MARHCIVDSIDYIDGDSSSFHLDCMIAMVYIIYREHRGDGRVE